MADLRSFLKYKRVKGYSKWKKDELVEKVTEVLEGGDGESESVQLPRPAPLPAAEEDIEESDDEEPLVKKPKKALSKTLEIKEEMEEDIEEEEPKKDSRPKCKYGAKCYRKNVDHFRQFRH